MNIWFIFIKLFINIIYLALMTLGYFLGIYVGKLVLDIPIFIIEFCQGIIGIGLMLTISNWLKNSLHAITKFALIYNISQGGNISVKKSILGCCKQFKNTFALILVNKIINDCILALVDNSEEIGIFKEVSKIKAITDSTILGKITNHLAKIQISYIDEYVLYYCYKHDYDSFYLGVKDGFVSYIKNTGSIVEKIVSTTISGLILEWACRVGIIVVYFKYFDVNIQSLLWVMFILSFAIGSLIREVIIDSFMLYSILSSGDELIDEESKASTVHDAFSILKELESIQLGSRV